MADQANEADSEADPRSGNPEVPAAKPCRTLSVPIVFTSGEVIEVVEGHVGKDPLPRKGATEEEPGSPKPLPPRLGIGRLESALGGISSKKYDTAGRAPWRTQRAGSNRCG